VLADCEMGIRLARSRDTNERTTAHIVIVTDDESEASIRRAMEVGVRGYLLLGATPASIVEAIHCVTRGGTALDPVVASKMLDSLSGVPITSRELQVLGLLMAGLSDKAIAHRLGIRPGTAKCHVKRLLEKLNARSRTEAVAIAQRRGLVRAPAKGERAADTVGPQAASSWLTRSLGTRIRRRLGGIQPASASRGP
jgi:DNA-binding NarL/FixJ family response regulator